MQKMDYKKASPQLYKPSAKVVECVDVPAMNYLMLDGQGDPGTSQEYADAIAALYPLAYGLKFMVKRGSLEMDFGVMPLEGLWWADDMSSFSSGDRDAWKWTLMIMQPELITAEMVRDASDQVAKKKNPRSLAKVRFESFEEGKVAQILHVGPFSEEGPTIERVHQFIADGGSERRGKHHEIYLSDIRRTAPEKLKTVIRQPMT